jgi:type II restriction enzyme
MPRNDSGPALGSNPCDRTLDVLNVVRSLGKREFALADVYACEANLARLHPQNLHVRDKIRQQLQRLRDLGFVEFLGAGEYRVT